MDTPESLSCNNRNNRNITICLSRDSANIKRAKDNENKNNKRRRAEALSFNMIAATLILVLSVQQVSSLLPAAKLYYHHGVSSSTKTSRSQLQTNFFSDIGDMLSGGKLVSQKSLPYGEPMGPAVSDEEKTLAIQERAISFTGEDFDVYDATANRPFCRVKGAMLHLPGKDKMKIVANGQKVAELDRKLVAITPTYDIYRGNGEKLGWIEKKQIALTDTFDVFLDGDGFGPFKSATYWLEGDFIDRRFVMKNKDSEVVAKVTKDGIQFFDEFNHYSVVVAPGMDPTLVVACACAIDEEFDEEHKEKKKREQEG